MKKILMVITLAYAILFLTQCKKEIVEQQGGDNSGEMIEVSLNVDNGGSSKTDISTSGIVTWEIGDVLHVVGETDGYIGYISAQNSGSSAYFTGIITKCATAQKFHYYYFGDKSVEEVVANLDGGEYYTYDISSQTGSLTDIANNLLLMHGDSGTAIASGETNLGSITMTSMISIVKLSFSVNSGTVICTGGYSGVKFNVKNGSLEKDGSSITYRRYKKNVNLDNVTSNAYYMVVIPDMVNISTKQALEFSQGIIGKSCNGPEGGFLPNKLYNNDSPKTIVLGELPYLPAIFTVNKGADNEQGTDDDTQVKFSKGNLQYIGNEDGTGIWRFATNQYDYIGYANNSLTAETRGNVAEVADYYYLNYGSGKKVPTNEDKKSVRDLFGWGTSGYHQSSDANNKHYLPYSTISETVNTTYNRFGYGPSTNAMPEGPSPSKGNVSGSYYDWGVYNDISNDGELGAGSWRTPTNGEWTCLINDRINASSHYGYGTVCGVHGLIILPDEWTGQYVTTGIGNYDTNIYSNSSDWQEMEFHGAVFLPASGYLYNASINSLNSNGRYWSSTYSDAGNSHIINITSGNVIFNGSDRCVLYPVRLVRNAE